MVRAPAPGTGGSRVRFTPGPRAGFASCTEQLAMTPCNDSLKQARSQVQVASARSQVQLTCEELKSLLRAAG